MLICVFKKNHFRRGKNGISQMISPIHSEYLKNAEIDNILARYAGKVTISLIQYMEKKFIVEDNSKGITKQW